MPIDHVTRGLSRLPAQFNGSTVLRTVLQIYLEEIQELEEAITEFLLQKNVDNAEGVQLDGIGEILGKLREGLSDSDYRDVLNIQKILNAGEGQYHTVLMLWQILTGSNTATVIEEFPAGVALYSPTGTPTLETITTLTEALPVTVTASFTSSIDASPAFCFFGGIGDGFGSTEDSSGGKFIGRYTNII